MILQLKNEKTKRKAKDIIYYINKNRCFICTSHFISKCGYPVISRGNKPLNMHRYIWELENGEIQNGLHVLHSCDNSLCININHLRLGTHQDNMKDMKDRNRAHRCLGILHPQSKLHEESVLEIFKSEESLSVLAKEYGVSKSTISYIKNGKSWSHLTEGK